MDNNNINIRKAYEKDKKRILEVCESIWEGHDYIPNIIDHWMKQINSYFLVLEYNNVITHFLRLRIQNDNIGWIEGLRGDKNYRRKGLANTLSEYVIDFAKKQGLKALRFATYFKNYSSIDLYKKLGFYLLHSYYLAIKTKPKLQNKQEQQKEEYNKMITQVDEQNIKKVLDYLNTSKMYEKYRHLDTNGWHFDPHSEKLYQQLLREGRVFTVKNHDGKINSLMVLRNQNNRPIGTVVGFLEGSEKERDILLNYVEKREKDKDEGLEIIIPPDKEYVDYLIRKGYETWEETEANVNLYEMKLV